MMDTVRVVGARVDRDRSGFASRRRGGGISGQFFDAEDVARLRPYELTRLLQHAGDLRIDRRGFDEVITMSNPGRGRCIPLIFIDGMRLDNIDAGTLNNWV